VILTLAAVIIMLACLIVVAVTLLGQGRL